MNLWAAPRLALLGRGSDAYDIDKLHQFKLVAIGGSIRTDTYNYPPPALLITSPFAFLPYLVAVPVWICGGYLAFFAAVRAAWPRALSVSLDAALYALAVPAALVNASLGQNGTWTAALLGGGLMTMERWPRVGGALLGLLIAKPQLAILVPVALLFTRRWDVLAAFVATSVLIITGTVLLFGIGIWQDFAIQNAFIRAAILGNETKTGVSLFFPSIFSMVRSLGAPLPYAYAAQGVAAAIVIGMVILCWRSPAQQTQKNAMLVIATFFVSPYVLVYDLVVAALVPLWLFADASLGGRWRGPSAIAFSLLIALPIAGPAISIYSGFGAGILFLVPPLVVTIHACLSSARAEAVSRPVRSGDDSIA